MIFWQTLFRRISKFHCSSVNFQFAFFFFLNRTQRQEELNNILTSRERIRDRVIPIRGSNLLENVIEGLEGKKISLQAQFAKENTQGQANSAKRFASGTTIERMKAPIINSITRARSGPGTGSKLKRVPCNYF